MALDKVLKQLLLITIVLFLFLIAPAALRVISGSAGFTALMLVGPLYQLS
jgi:hypothetical protein